MHRMNRLSYPESDRLQKTFRELAKALEGVNSELHSLHLSKSSQKWRKLDPDQLPNLRLVKND
jgi:hypothetical protein